MDDMKQASVYSGDSAYSIPTQTIPPSCLDTMRSSTAKLAKESIAIGYPLDKYADPVMPGKSLNDLGFTKEGIPVEGTLKMYQGQPHAADMIASGQIHLMVITSLIKPMAGN
ncbi:hypothetical protein J1N35_044893 [Gossypium stocksii]|uniref:Uncharacterized protein n=1 Tax=Gossypium stocksii TaxID=47602 RepID=A0A9D3ZG28_9ROSI|nr:hypothetical protein J1N35_044893 [Gossypium stocksii]